MSDSALNHVLAPHGGYRRMFSYGYARILDRATAVFCNRAWSYQNDALGKARGQLLGASRSVRANIAEGSERAGLSKDTELNLLSVARGSLAEMADDFEAFLFEHGEAVWSENDPRRAAVEAVRMERFAAESDERHAYSQYLLSMWPRFAPLFEEPASLCDAANAALVLVDKATALLTGQIAAATKETVEKGGFRERMTRARIERRDGLAQPPPEIPVPACPECGQPMRLRTAKSGPSAGKPFWGCSGYPGCKGKRPAEEGSSPPLAAATDAGRQADEMTRRRETEDDEKTRPKTTMASAASLREAPRGAFARRLVILSSRHPVVSSSFAPPLAGALHSGSSASNQRRLR